MSTFEDLLERAKKRSVTNTIGKQWKQRINNIMEGLHALNEMYGTKMDVHNSNIEQIKCDNCKTASFLIAVKDIGGLKKVIKFYRAGWTSKTKGVYVCEKCK